MIYEIYEVYEIYNEIGLFKHFNFNKAECFKSFNLNNVINDLCSVRNFVIKPNITIISFLIGFIDYLWF